MRGAFILRPFGRGLGLAALVALGVLPCVGSAAEPAAPPAPAAPAPPAAPPAPAAPRTPAVPAAPATAAAPAAAAVAKGAPPVVSGSNPRPGIVRLERGGRRLGFGVVLRADGRILTALSALGHGNYVRARFFDDHVLGVRVVESDRTWDLALLAPEGGQWIEGLRASSVDAAAAGTRLRRFGGHGREIAESPALIKGRQVLLGRDGATLEDALVLGGSLAEDELGSPICDEGGDVSALVGQACDPAVRQDCRLIPYGVPVSAIKQFLKAAPAREPLPAAWLGLRGVAGHSGSVGGVRVVAVEPGSPAEQAGLRARAEPMRGNPAEDAGGDLIVAVADSPVTTPEELRDAINRVALMGGTGRVPEGSAGAVSAGGPAAGGAAPGKPNLANPATASAAEGKVRLLVYGAGRFREVDLPLRAPVQIPAQRQDSGRD